jgi:lysyl-tRNA synthetase, class I
MTDYHWADTEANKIIKQKKNKEEYVIATGVTPSGTIHIGNFREFITGNFILRAINAKGKKAIHYHYWDDYDVFRKVPVNMPNQETLKKYLRQALVYVPDFIDGNHEDYAEHNEKEVENLLKIVDLHPTIIRQSHQYLKCKYSEEIKIALNNIEKIKEIFNKYRKEELEENWLPISLYCEKCHIEAEKINYLGEYSIEYECSCGNKDTIDFRKKGLVKLKWRIQWPAWWHNMKVDFESAGKDHFASGGSIDTGRDIQKEIYGTEPPIGFGFGWISVKGGKQFSSSQGIIITLQDVLEIYEPSIVRYLFAGSRPSAEFAISFDSDVLKIYEDFDKTERIYFEEEKVENEKKKETEKRNYELSVVEMPEKMPCQPSFRHLTTLIQIYNFKVDEVLKQFEIKNEFDRKRLKTRIECSINWLKKYAPDEYKFELQHKVSEEVKKKLHKKEKEAILIIAEKLKANEYDENTLFKEFYSVSKELGVEPKDFFRAAYYVLLNKEKGPKLAPFVLSLGHKAIKLFEELR